MAPSALHSGYSKSDSCTSFPLLFSCKHLLKRSSEASFQDPVGAFVMRYDFVVAGEVYPNVVKGLPSYMPTFMESLLILGIFAGFLLAYTIGEKILPLKEVDFSKLD